MTTSTTEEKETAPAPVVGAKPKATKKPSVAKPARHVAPAKAKSAKKASPAKKAGIQPGDIIITADGQAIDRVSALQRRWPRSLRRGRL